MRHLQTIQQFRVGDFVLIKEIMAILVDRNAHVFAFCLDFTGNTRRQIHFDSFHVNLTQAHHHKTGEQKEHDVDQRDDLDPRFLMWNR